MMYSTMAQASIQASTHSDAAKHQPQVPLAILQLAQRVKQLTLAFSAVQKALQKVTSCPWPHAY